ncbi:iron-only hydrogenase maturation protein HydE [Cetobacterium ceti]|uniref:Iron-only hydrogenase maturation protein HydE n=1 Tax=Cetobacterium ceti TaxID=180163 RepID=A0A1T4MV61_9FUSO|nr:[FeFe] hydrogenase H-cluster radical SAM maturase HydE [Cetobacterium ceti]SJZ70882.1 iron-only hydrogenase maturation protein HydE [Cetobacterium ceti]
MLKKLIDKLYINNNLNEAELLFLLKNLDDDSRNYLIEKAYHTRLKSYGKTVFFRGLIEISNICSRNCFYCGIRAENKNVQRYRLSKEEILLSCEKGYQLGYKTFVLQGGEDAFFKDEVLVDIIKSIKIKYPENAITLSLGERSYESYKALYEAGADRYLLRHETANKALYHSLHPNMNFENRIQCLNNLKEIGYQIGAGFLIGLPNQTLNDFVQDLKFLKNLEPHMVGIGPFIPQKDTPLRYEKGGDAYTTITMLAIIRLLLPDVLLPATTALGTIDPESRNKAFKAGANVIMPNLSPFECRKKYALYDGKVFTNGEAAEEKKKIDENIRQAGFEPVMSRGDNIKWKRI